jgi:D-alanyl-D-alanine carboxypeptidase/D-alanyl-D-alanine-endopeptidase (penicillin-binding protein 4)
MKKQFYVFKKLLIINCVLLICISSSAQISNLADSILINDSAISSGHIGIAVYDATDSSYLYNYNAAKYFVPASNTRSIV